MRPVSILSTRGGVEGVGGSVLATVSCDSRAGCKERMYTSSTAGGERTAGRDGRGVGPPRLTRRKPFNPAGSVRGGGDSSVMLMQPLECTASLSQESSDGVSHS